MPTIVPVVWTVTDSLNNTWTLSNAPPVLWAGMRNVLAYAWTVSDAQG